MTGQLFTLGYAASDAKERLNELMGDDLHATPIQTLLVDIRYSTRDRLFPQWNASALHRLFRHCYAPLGWSLGDVNQDTDKPITLANPNPGINSILWHLRRGTNIVLLCADENSTHCQLVAQMVQALMRERMPT
jgi:hypothetical protein